MANLQLSFAHWDYDRTRALEDGRVKCDGVDLNHISLPVDEIFFRMAKFQEFDIAEMSLSTYCMTLHSEDRPFVAIPVFPSRFFRHSCIYVNTDSGITCPEDLKGKRVASPEYQMTAPVWIRGMLNEDYGVDISTQAHYTGGQEQAGRIERSPLSLPWVTPIPSDKTLSQMLYDGEIDALYAARTPSAYLKGDGRVVRLFENFGDVEREYYRRTGIFPIMHTVVIRREIYEKNPWIAQNLTKALTQSQEYTYTDLMETDALKAMLPWLPAHIADTRKEFGDDWWAYGFDKNLHTLSKFCEYHYEQGLSKRLLNPSELFAAETLQSYKL
jgi:4,5-dihydroxyphthalate decarboxylase